MACYSFFIDKFVDAIRYENARSAEKAYDSLNLNDMAKMFMIDNQNELRAFIEANNMKVSINLSV